MQLSRYDSSSNQRCCFTHISVKKKNKIINWETNSHYEINLNIFARGSQLPYMIGKCTANISSWATTF